MIGWGLWTCNLSISVCPASVQPSQVISPEENIFLYEGVVLYTLDKPIPMGISSPELSFKGFGTVSPTDDNYMYNCPSPSALDF